ncbi:hypothetical protein HFD88_005725 [Aspergillus terreus]|nr:hypothetical protein HFD88_005725 [Aspergillus terreus]
MPSAELKVSADRSSEIEDVENFQPKSPSFWLIILGVYLSIFLVALDRTVVATAIPRITDEFSSIADVGCPIYGRAYQIYSTKWVFFLSLAIFEAGSAVCGAAPGSTSFIIGRAIAGLGGAGIFSGGMLTIITLVPLRKRPIFVSIFGMVFGISSVLGPVVGGSLTDHVTWRWCFYINLPVGSFTMAAVLFLFRVESPDRQTMSLVGHVKRLDPFGVSLFVPSIVSLFLALQWGGTNYSWSAPTIIGLLVTFGVLFLAFLAVEIATPETAMIPARVVLNRSIAGSMLFVFLITGGMMSLVYYLSIWFQVIKGNTAMEAGLSTLPLVLSLVLMGVLSAALTQKIGYYVPAMLVAPVLCAIGAGLLSTLSPTSDHAHWIGYQVLFGLGVGCGFQTSNLAAQTVLPPADIPIGVALILFMQQLGGSALLAVDQNILSTKLVDRLSNIATIEADVIINTGATDLRSVVPPTELSNVMKAYNYVLTFIFVIGTATSAAALLGAMAMEWRSIKPRKRRDENQNPQGRILEQ